MGEPPRTELVAALRSLHNSKEYSDLVLVAADGSRHRLHRALVCPRSRYFQDAVREGRWLDGDEGRLALLDEDPYILRLLVDYFYLLDYEPVLATAQDTASSVLSAQGSSDSLNRDSDYHIFAFNGYANLPYSAPFHHRSDSPLIVPALTSSTYTGGPFSTPATRRKPSPRNRPKAPEPSPLATVEPNLTLHARMHAAACRFGVEGLRLLALDKFKIQLTRHWDADELAEAIHVVYTATPAGEMDMREAVANTLHWHPQLLDKPEIEFAIMGINGLAYELLKRSRRAEPEHM